METKKAEAQRLIGATHVFDWAARVTGEIIEALQQIEPRTPDTYLTVDWGEDYRTTVNLSNCDQPNSPTRRRRYELIADTDSLIAIITLDRDGQSADIRPMIPAAVTLGTDDRIVMDPGVPATHSPEFEQFLHEINTRKNPPQQPAAQLRPASPMAAAFAIAFP